MISKGKWWAQNSVWILLTMILVFYLPVAVVIIQLKRPDFVPLVNFGSFVAFIFLLCVIVSFNQIRLAHGLSRRKKVGLVTRSGLAGLLTFLLMLALMIPIGFILTLVVLFSADFVYKTLPGFSPSDGVIVGLMIILPSVVASPITGMAMGLSINSVHSNVLGSEIAGEPGLYWRGYSIAGLAYILVWIADRATQFTIADSGNLLYALILNLIFLIASSQAIAAPLSHFLYPVVQRISELDTQVTNSTDSLDTESLQNVKR